jgi:hypothetical protein
MARELVEVIFRAENRQLVDGLSKVEAQAGAADKKTGLLSKSLGKMGVDSKSAGAAMSGALAGGLAAAATAAVAFGVKSVASFQQGALAADKMSRATGLSVEQASRWIEAGDDLGITADQLGSAFGRFTKTLGSNSAAFKQYGVEAVRAKDGTVDMNATLLNTVGTLNRMSDPIERNKLATAAFGRGWQEVGELVTMSAGDVSKALADVSDQRVFDGSEVAKAKNYRAAMDDLGDSVTDLQNELGEGLVPALAASASGLSDLIGVANGLPDWMQSGGLGGLSTVFKEVWKDLGGGGKGEEAQAQIDAATEAWVRARGAAIDMNVTAEDLTAQNEELADAQRKAADAARDQADALRDAADAQLSALSSSLGLANAVANAEDQIGEYQATMASATATQRDQDAAGRELKGSLLSVASAAVKAAEDQAKAKGASFGAADALRAQQLALTALKQSYPGLAGVIDAFISKLNAIPRTVTTQLRVVGANVPASASGRGPYTARAAGGPVSAGQAISMNERSNTGPRETFVPGASGNVIPAPMLPGGGGLGGINITVNVQALDVTQRTGQLVVEGLVAGLRGGGLRRVQQALGV